jgi:hypothetical protein
MAKDLGKQFEGAQGLNDTLKETEKLLAKATDENDKVYFMKVPSSVTDPEGKVMVKCEPLPDPQQTVEVDRFASLVPASVHKSALAYAAMRQDMCNQIISQVQADTQNVRTRMLRITPQLEALDLSEPGVPKRLRERIPAIQATGHVKGLLERINATSDLKKNAQEMLDTTVALIGEEEKKDVEMRAKFGSKWTRSMSATINAPLKKDHEQLAKQMQLAADADSKVLGKLSAKQEVLEMLGMSLEQLDAKVAGGADRAYEVMEHKTQTGKVKEIADKLKVLLQDIEKMIQHRETLRTQFLQRVQVEHPVRAVLDLHIAGVPHDEAFKRLLGGYGEWRDAFTQNLHQV